MLTLLPPSVARFLARCWFLLGLLAVLVAGFSAPTHLDAAAQAVPRHMVVAAVLFMMAVPLEASAMWRVLSKPLAPALAVCISYGLLPPLAWLVALALPKGLAAGVVIAAVAPCTLASAAVWTRRAGGNDAIALLVTMFTNLACFALAPFWLRALLGTRVELPVTDMAAKLVTLVAVPIVLGQLIRLVEPIGFWAIRNRLGLGVASQLGILTIVFVGSVKSGLALRQQTAEASVGHWATMLAGVAALHLVGLVIGYRSALRLGLPRPDAIAVGVAGSQKTLMVGLLIATEYSAQFGELAVLPMVAYHVLQLFLDTVWTDRLRRPAKAPASPASPNAP